MIQLIHSAILFSRNFRDKITQIHASFPGHASSSNINFPAVHHSCTVFKPDSLNEVAKLIYHPLNKSCELDPIPTFLLKSSLHALNFPITKIINLSLSVPFTFKTCQCKPSSFSKALFLDHCCLLCISNN